MRHALVVDRVGKSFRQRNNERTPTFRAWVESGFGLRMPNERHWALRDVSLTVAPGEMVGVIGRNGSGKSTLLRLMAGVMKPDEGSVMAAAPVRGLLQLNSGAHPDLTGRENIVINGVLGGLLRSEVEARMDDIIRFAELEDSIDQPVRTYSSGMKLRLGFASAVHVDPKILLIDEVLAVGDLAFQQKCLARIEAFRSQGCAIVLITHDMSQVRSHCDRAIWLDGGHLRAEGRPEPVVDAYEDQSRAKIAAQAQGLAPPEEGAQRFGTREVLIDDVLLLARDGTPANVVARGEGLTVSFRLTGTRSVAGHVSISIADTSGRLCLDANTATDGVAMTALGGDQVLTVDLDRLDLSPGRYFLSVGAWKPDWSEPYDMHMDAYPFDVEGGPNLLGVLAPPRRWTIQS